MRKITFIVNPNSGTIKEKTGLIENLKNICKEETNGLFKVQTYFTEGPSHATKLAQQAVLEKVELCIAVGGDGTMHETALGLIGSETSLGIIPIGSGNGLARHIGLSMNPEIALSQLLKGISEWMDVGKIDGQYFFLAAGIGFEGTVTKLFSQQKNRGFLQYLLSASKAFWGFNPLNIMLNGNETRIFTLTFANGSQYGNNAMIAPGASIFDGLLNVTRILPFPFYKSLELVYRLLHKKLRANRYCKMSVHTKLEINLQNETAGHVDGEPIVLHKNFTVEIVSEKLKVRLPRVDLTENPSIISGKLDFL